MVAGVMTGPSEVKRIKWQVPFLNVKSEGLGVAQQATKERLSLKHKKI